MPNPHSNCSFGRLHTYSFNSSISNSNFNGFQLSQPHHHSGESIAVGYLPASQDEAGMLEALGNSLGLPGFSIFMLRLIVAIQPTGALSLRLTRALRPAGVLL